MYSIVLSCILGFLILESQHGVQSWSLNNFLMTGPKAYLTFSQSVAAGAMHGMEECRHQFLWDRWNCPESSLPMFTQNALERANRETSFVHAISSAGVMYTLTRNCSLGDFDKCGCDDTKKGDQGGEGWKWGGCSDNVNFGERVSKMFVDALVTGKDAWAVMNLHNNEAGRKAVRQTLKRTCKCHGVSGSCTTQTCWKQLSEFRVIGDFLKRKYGNGLLVDYVRGGLEKANSASEQALSPLSKKDLVYLEASPDYCRVNVSAGSMGTVGRECVRGTKKSKDEQGKWEKQSCKRLCSTCGLKVKKTKVIEKSSCNCKFHWCCSVKCDECQQEVTKLTCQT
ncbi:wingless-type MMTV integration site family, member 8 precursor [Saccoglossus kowalevskii]|uniref:Protein Wnt n=1 Tax=Saccoglossus kowalevskii TaxID=10224 RepID=D1LXI5_SACKO|nr:wingless-type MMTV integration site family, member 8 precursor [Saccoglossus kowalevskii]ACY92691.1 Wnt8 [Saccoglossus kowalevskii]